VGRRPHLPFNSAPPSVYLHHLTLGRGAPGLIALHGGLGWDHTSLRPWLDPLAEHATLTYADLTGCGRSPAPEDWSTVTHATWADDVEALRRHLHAERGGHDPVVLFGHSYGGIIALEVARRYPEHVCGLILCCTLSTGTHMAAAAERAFARAEGRTAEVLTAALSGPPQRDAEFAALFPDLLPLYVHDPDAHDLAAYAERMTLRAAPLRRTFYDLLAGYDVREQLDAVGVPALVLSGRHDWIAPPDESPADFLAGLAGAEGHVLEASGHFPFMEEPDAFVTVVRDWLAAHAPTHVSA
jgi:proline iminopeptidase